MLLQVRDVYKSFGANDVLKGVNLEVGEAEIHSLLGLNGAGKSTLVSLICGIHQDFKGDIIFAGENINNISVRQRQLKGIYLVPQHAEIVPEYSIAENIFVGTWPKKNILTIDRKKMFDMAKEHLVEYGIDIDPSIKGRELSLIDKRKLNIIRALYSQAKLIILDEPTTSLNATDRSELFSFIKQLKAMGTSFIFITHYLDEVLEISDQVTVLRDGCAYKTQEKQSSEEELSRLIVGENVELVQRRKPQIQSTDSLIECSDIYASGVNGVNLQIKQGEIVGLVGQPGSGAREIARALYGLNPITKGKIAINGKQIKPPCCAYDAMKQKIIYISNDRHAEGVVPMMSIYQNISLGIINLRLKKFMGIIDQGLENECVDDYYARLKIKGKLPDSVGSLSGGNQQKVVVAKALSCEPDLLILDEPTIGIDVHTREEILSLCNSLTEQGKAAIYITNDYNELLRICDRLVFFHDGIVAQETQKGNLQPEDVISIRDSIMKGGMAI